MSTSFVMPAPAAAPAGSGLASIPGSAGLPLIGDSVQLLHDPVGWATKRYERYGPVSWTSAFGKTIVTLLGPDAWDAPIMNRDKLFASGDAWNYLIGPFFPRGLMLLDFDEHLFHKRIMMQAFAKSRLTSYLDGMNPVIADGLAVWSESDRFRTYPALKQLTLDIATRTFMGAPLGPGADRINRAFIDCVHAGTAYVRFPVPGLRWSRGLHGRKVLEQMLREQLPSKRAGDGADLFSALCHAESDDGHSFSDDDVINHMIFLLMAAHDTTTITMTTMMYYLAKHPEWQERCRAESLALGSPTLDFGGQESLHSLDLVMKESLRLLAPLPEMPRATVADAEVLGHFLPAGTFVMVMPQLNHLMSEYWPEPRKFDPERFADDRREDKVHKHAWVPFGGGVHKCIGQFFGGMQVKAVLHQVLQKFEWSVDPNYEIRWDMTSLPAPKDGLRVRMRELNSSH
ncbi:cytochrome P450 [Antrihabitans stalactiti]|uniref:Cytochrome P450 n=1 Tax=Antrihabitans stalactiti TaxID=2584121 RepID=A0A848K8S1_9NOCA|nr:cytochrome P450 [Antrihabitans stalactiti]NMN94046.1 cytochrome P450 [Antrihabitans stalactiti]